MPGPAERATDAVGGMLRAVAGAGRLSPRWRSPGRST